MAAPVDPAIEIATGESNAMERTSPVSEALPCGWEACTFYVNHNTRSTTWTHPNQLQALPPGWEACTFYVNHNAQSTTWTHPNQEHHRHEAEQQRLEAERQRREDEKREKPEEETQTLNEVEPTCEFSKSDRQLYEVFDEFKKAPEDPDSEKDRKASCYEKLVLAYSRKPDPDASLSRKEEGTTTETGTVSITHTAELKQRHWPWAIRKIITVLQYLQLEEVLTPILRYASAKGTNSHKKLVLPLVRNIIRDGWVFTELLMTVGGLGLSIASFVLGRKAAFNIVHLVLAIVSTILALIDGYFNLRQCKSCKLRNSKVAPLNDENYRQETETSSCSTKKKEQTSCKSQCKERFRDASDILRIILAELILYPLVVCNMFGFITGQGWKTENALDYVNFILFIISSLGLFAFVYIIRLIILAGMIIHVQRIRNPRTKDGSTVSDHDDTISKAALWFQFYFFVHVLLQMVVQILMLVSIGAKIQFDNREFLVNKDASIHISPYLWYMLVAGYIMPICGILTFFIVAYYWVQEFPIGLCIDLLFLLKRPGVDSIMYPKDSTQDRRLKVEKIRTCFENTEQNFKKMHDKSFSSKISYPFKSTVLVVLCYLYTACQIVFTVCCVFTESGDKVYLNGGGWFLFYFACLLPIGGLANFFTFLVAGFWTVIIIITIIIILIIITGYILYGILIVIFYITELFGL